jgi:RimJ/RimL family protein N-acetyltransferase
MIALRPAVPNDVQFVYDLRMRPDVREGSLNPNMFPYVAHCEWFAKMVPGPGDTWVGIIEVFGIRAGVLTLTVGGEIPSYDWNRLSPEVGIALLPEYRGQGIATYILSRCLPSDWTYMALIKPENLASQATFSRAGYAQQSKHVWVRYYRGPGGTCHS